MWIQSVDPGAARGLLKEVYDAAVRRAGRVFQIVRAMSLAPRTLEASLELYKRVMLGPGTLARYQREMLAVVVSRANDCHY
jgi:alkylhydroperoxidase family enzyme